MNYITLKVGEEEYKLKATTAAKVDAEKILGCSLAEAVDKAMESRVISVLLWAALQKLNHGMEMKKVYNLLDRMEDEGFELDGEFYEAGDISAKASLGLKILQVSGFFTMEQASKMNEKLAGEEVAQKMNSLIEEAIEK